MYETGVVCVEEGSEVREVKIKDVYSPVLVKGCLFYGTTTVGPQRKFLHKQPLQNPTSLLSKLALSQDLLAVARYPSNNSVAVATHSEISLYSTDQLTQLKTIPMTPAK